MLFQVVKDLTARGTVEFAEKKGRGHPDSLADALAELISYEYARYCLAEFGAVLHHHFDKLVIAGGEARVSPGSYEQVSPIRIVLNGRVSRGFGRSRIPVAEIARQAIGGYLPTVLPQIKDSHWELVDNTSPVTGSSSKGLHWWAPRDLSDIPDLQRRTANDTSVAVASLPPSPVEHALIEAEQALFDRFVLDGQCGSDVKLLAARTGATLAVTACVPVLATSISDRDGYDQVKEAVRILLQTVITQATGISEPVITVNTRDDVGAGDLYLLGLGTAAEHGDQGAVGRGNRTSGLVSTEMPMSVEAPWGKNPVYFSGFVYDACARAVSHAVHDTLKLANSTYIASQNGRAIADPWRAIVRVPPLAARAPDDIALVAEKAFHSARRIDALFADIRHRYPHLARGG